MFPNIPYIDRVGVELEGGWNRLFPDIQIVKEISLHLPLLPNVKNGPGQSFIKCSCDEGHSTTEPCHYGEIPSPPLFQAEIAKWIGVHYPDAVNQSCGFHIHVSTKNVLQYSQLVDKGFYDLFLKRVEKWGKDEQLAMENPLWDRLRNKDRISGFARFSNHPFAPFQQMKLAEKKDVRRSALNYCYRMHGTLEARIFPMFTSAAQAVRAMVVFLETVEDWLSSRPAEKPEKIILLRDELNDVKEARAPFAALRT